MFSSDLLISLSSLNKLFKESSSFIRLGGNLGNLLGVLDLSLVVLDLVEDGLALFTGSNSGVGVDKHLLERVHSGEGSVVGLESNVVGN